MIYLIPLIASGLTCNKYTCGSLENPYGCISQGPNVTLQSCNFAELQQCPYTDFSENSTCVYLPPSPYQTALPGDFCYSNSTCVSMSCVNSICQGLLASDVCTDTSQCNPGLGCNSGNCMVLQPIGPSSACTVDYDCVNNAACENGNCFQYFSRSEGVAVVNCDNGVNWLCESGMCYNSFCISANASSFGALPVKCSDDNDCISTYYNEGIMGFNLTSNCQCGFNSQSQSYCSLFPGDSVQASYLNVLNRWLSSQQLFSCHSINRFELACIKLYWDEKDYLEYAYYYYYSTMYPQIQDNSDCIQSILTYQFYQAQQAYQDYSSYGLWILSSIVIGYII